MNVIRGADDPEIEHRLHIPQSAQPGAIVWLRHELYRTGLYNGAVHLDTRTHYRSMLALICNTVPLWRAR